MANGVNPYTGRSHTSTGMMSQVRGDLTMSVETPGLEELIARLQKYAAIGDTDAKRVRAGMSKSVKLVYGQALKTVPVRTGKMKGQLLSKVKTWNEGNVTGNVGLLKGPYGPGSQVLVPAVLEGGRRANRNGRMEIQPRRWLWHALTRSQEQINAIWAQVIELITRDLAGKG